MKKRKLFLLIILMISIVAVGTLAYFSVITERTALVLVLGEKNEVLITLKPFEINGTLMSTLDYTSFETNETDNDYIQITAQNFAEGPKEVYFYYRINSIDSTLASSATSYAITSSTTIDGTYTEVLTGNFSGATSENDLVVYKFTIPGETTMFYRVFTYLDGSQDVSAMSGKTLNAEFRAEIKHKIVPELDEGMIPVVIDNSGSSPVVKTIYSDDEDWFNYEERQWANAVLVSESSRGDYANTSGITIGESDILAYYVWIPRFEYRYTNLGTSYAGGSQSNPRAISINFIPSYRTLPSSNGYKIHPAFTFGDLNVSGFWVGKFETTGTVENPKVLPLSQSLSEQKVSTLFESSLKFNGGTLSGGAVSFDGSDYYGTTNKFDSHMMKNSEWGAVAYLTQSIYGACSTATNCVSVYPNNSGSYTTGKASGSSTLAWSSNGSYNWYEDEGLWSSTTQNITGVYDMSGGSLEQMMSVFHKDSNFIYTGNASGINGANSGFKGYIGDTLYDTTGYTDLPPQKYYDRYTTTSLSTSCYGKLCYGHALSETNGWYGDVNSGFVNSTNPWLVRGGGMGTDTASSTDGIFTIANSTGGAAAGATFRSVILYPIITDSSAPIVTFDADGSSTYAKSHSTVVTVSDENEITTLKYLWSQDQTTSAENGTAFSSGDTITKSDGDGFWYLCVYSVDSLGNVGNTCSNFFQFDNTGPEITTISDTQCLQKKSTLDVSNFVTVTDDGSGVSPENISVTLSGSAVTNLSSQAPGTYTVTYNATDNLGNAATSKTITFNVYTKILGDQTIVTSGNGFYTDALTSGRYYFRGNSPSNYLTFNNQTWRILSMEADGTFKIVYNGIYSNGVYHGANEGLLTYSSTTINGTLTSFYNSMGTTEKNQIASHTFYTGKVGTNSGAGINTILSLEKASSVTTYVALPSITDYLRASTEGCDSCYWELGESYTDTNWMYNSSTHYHLLNPYSDERSQYQNTSGAISTYIPNYNRGIRPTAFLKNTTTFTGSGTSSDKYVVNPNCAVEQTNQTSSTTCSISTTDGWETSKVLTITPSSTTGISYSWDYVTWGETNTKTISSAGKFPGYIKDSSNATNTCSINISSRTEYRSRTCPNANLSFGNWYQSSVTHASSCSAYSKTQAQNEYSNWYRTCETTADSVCEVNFGLDVCYISTSYMRDANCNKNNGFEDATWSSWSATAVDSKFNRQVQTRTTYSAS